MAQWTWDAVEETLFHVGGATGTDSRCRRCNVLVRHDTLTCHTNPVHGAFSLTTLNSRHNGTSPDVIHVISTPRLHDNVYTPTIYNRT
ncbi:hypothetical protein IAQ61_004574 [Plenodomus lingam]|uniref:uncharacterized protein n=1 Tax=Leptosphaeria maculans TaxID=5022 RepID=UPI003320C08D|nr:hypothetical protein IAQ61_004574 [Plenodomus lingam]